MDSRFGVSPQVHLVETPLTARIERELMRQREAEAHSALASEHSVLAAERALRDSRRRTLDGAFCSRAW